MAPLLWYLERITYVISLCAPEKEGREPEYSHGSRGRMPGDRIAEGSHFGELVDFRDIRLKSVFSH
jgi:hypothetical protein